MRRFIITTCRRPGRRLRSFVKDLIKVLPGGIRITRGKQSLDDLAILAQSLGVNLMMIVDSMKGNPARFRFFEVKSFTYEELSFKILFSGIKLIREIPNSDLPSRVSSCIIATYENAYEDIRFLCENLANLFDLPYIEAESVELLKGMADTIMWISPSKMDLAKIIFINGKSGKTIGPILRVRKVIP